jgi:hypothetical protein
MFWFNDLKIYYNKTVLLEAEKEIRSVIISDKFIVICYDPEIITDNIVCLDVLGNEVWRTKGVASYMGRKIESFSNMFLDGDLINSYNLAGYLCQIDIHSGKIINQDLVL